MRRLTRSAYLSILAALLTGLTASPSPAQRGERSELLKDRPLVLRHELRRINPIRNGDNLSVDLAIAGQVRRLNLHPHSLRGSDFRVLIPDESGLLVDSPAPVVSTFRGDVDGEPATQVIASIGERGLEAQINFADGGTWHLAPAREALRDATAAAEDYALFREEDVIAEPWGCGTIQPEAHQPEPADGWNATASAASVASGGGYKVVEIAFDADTEFYQLNSSKVANVVADIENVMNGVAAKYETQFGATFEITTIVVRTLTDPYTSTNNQTLLTQFQSEWNTNMRHIHRDIAHLMTGRIVQGGVIGAAYIDEMCDVCGVARGYGFSQSRFSTIYSQRVHLTTHELGHSLGACHCDEVCASNSCYDDCGGDWSTDADCGIMCSSITGCGGDASVFEARGAAAIDETLSSVSCLSIQNAPLELPFCDSFNGAIDAIGWSYNVTASIVVSNNAPSPPNAMLLDGCCAGCNSLPAPDEIRSNRIRLAGATGATLSYYVRYAGSASGAAGDLVVEYRSNADAWVQFEYLNTAAGPEPAFQLHSGALPPDALHDDFRVRFRLAAADSQASWEIDDVSISTATAASPILYVKADAAPGGHGGSWEDAYRTLTEALSSAECSLGLVEEIWVAAGLYTPDQGSGSRESTFQMQDGLKLYGGFAGFEVAREERDPAANPTTLSGDIGQTGDVADDVYHVITVGASSGSLIDGFTIRGGYANGFYNNPPGKGAGVYHSGGIAEFINCRFVENAAGNGGAVHARIGGELRFTDCEFSDNSAILQGGAIAADSGATVHLDRCRLIGNYAGAYGGAAYIGNSLLYARNSLLTGNTSDIYGGALYVTGSNPFITNCTLYRNTAAIAAGGIYSNFAGADLVSAILWNNVDPGGMNENSQLFGSNFSYNVNYSIVQGWTGAKGGEGNSAANPNFADPVGLDTIPGTQDDDLRPVGASAALDSGDPNALPLPGETDILGRPRVLCSQIDMGPYEAGWGDFDCNGMVEPSDGAGWATCLTGPESSNIAAACLGLDLDESGTVDLVDFSIWMGLLGAP